MSSTSNVQALVSYKNYNKQFKHNKRISDNSKNKIENENDFLNIENKKTKKQKNKRKKMRQKKKKENHFISPGLEEVIAFFKINKQSITEAHKFYNHFESNGWLVGGKTKMKNWNAAARNWMLNVENFKNNRHPELVEGPKPNHLHTTNTKNYDEPL